MAATNGTRGMIAVDKMGCKILFIDPESYETETVIDGFQRTVHELLVVPETGLAYVPIFGDGIHGRNPNPGHTLWVIDLIGRKLAHGIDLRPLSAPHTVRLGADGFIYITCENSAKVAVIEQGTHKVVGTIDSGSTNAHRLAITADGSRLYTDNEEDATVSVIDVANRRLLGKIKTPQAIAGIAVSNDSQTVVAVSDETPVIYFIDAGTQALRELPLKDVPKAAQIARYSNDGKLLIVTSLNSDTVSLISTANPGDQTAITVGRQPMDFTIRGGDLFVACQGDGSIHIVDIADRKHKTSFKAGTGCESIGFF
ncbi:MAG: hypothetical protein AB7O50_12810 [Pseudolabrys sp.]